MTPPRHHRTPCAGFLGACGLLVALGSGLLAPGALALGMWGLGTLALAACGGDDGAVIVVRVEGRPTLAPLAALEVVVDNAGASTSRRFPLAAGERLPLSFTITPEGRTGELGVAVVGQGVDGGAGGRVSARTTIVPGERVDLTLTVEPDDFVINEAIARAQLIVFDRSLAGRQLAVAPDGSFLVGWENDCPLARCDQLARRFGPDAQPAQNRISMTDGEFIVNQSPEYTESPSFAAGQAGYFAAWLNRATADIGAERSVRGAVIDRDGARLAAVGDLVISSDPADEAAVASFAQADGSFVVVWERTRVAPAIGNEIRARLYGADGVARANAVTGDSSDFPVAATLGTDQAYAFGAGLAGGGFVVVWVEAGAQAINVKGRVFGATGVPASGSDLALSTLAAGAASGPRVAATAEGFVAGWKAQSSGVPALASAPLLIRRFAKNGTPASSEIFVTPATSFFNAAPALAVRADGAIGVAWDDCEAEGDQDGGAASCGIRFRLFTAHGLPVGDSLVVNTTTKGEQLSPSIREHPGGGFVLAWSDGSAQPPDTDDSAVRGRVIYPALDRSDGVIGARCGESGNANCGAELLCKPDAAGVGRCHPVCTSDCPGGGTCLEASYCAFQ